MSKGEEINRNDVQVTEEDYFLDFLRCCGALDLESTSSNRSLLVHTSRRENIWLVKKLLTYRVNVRACDHAG